MAMIRIYFDSCCLSRPLDDQKQDRVRLEAEAILRFLEHVDQGRWTMIGSYALDAEIAAIRDPVRRQNVTALTTAATEHIRADPNLLRRAWVLESMGFGVYDSVHIACAEIADADVLLTTDDALIRRARRLHHELGVPVSNPLTWLKEHPE
jgi:predicted nucleic acid-binding protein